MRLHLAAGAILMACLLAIPALAQRNGLRQGEKYALLIGVRRYDPNQLRSLLYSEPDVVDLAVTLKAQGYKPGNVILMTQTVGADDPRFAPEAVKIRKELTLLLEGMEEEDSVLVALAGHGVQFRGETESYFCPSDAKLDERHTLIPLGEVYKDLENCKAGLKVLLVDACRNDPQSDNSRSRSLVTLESVTRPQRIPPPGGVVAFFSCSEGERAFEHSDLKHGVFFHFVNEAMKGGAVGPADSEVLIPDLEKYVKRNVRDYVRDKFGERQRPELRGTSRDLVPLVRLSKVRAPERPSPGPSSPDVTKSIRNSIGMKLVLIAGGVFLMGAPDSEPNRDQGVFNPSRGLPQAVRDQEIRSLYAHERPQHRVRITRAFYLGEYEVTQQEYQDVMGTNPSSFSATGKNGARVAGKDTRGYPVENVSWHDAVTFCNRLSVRETLAPYYAIDRDRVKVKGGTGYRLPTEAEWEFACRAGTTSPFAFGEKISYTNANFGSREVPGRTSLVTDGLQRTAQVGSYRPNAWGLFDMHGNVQEWCWDWYDHPPTGSVSLYYQQSPTNDPSGPFQGHSRINRGGSWIDHPSHGRSAYRRANLPQDRLVILGFRVARSLPGEN